MRGFVKNLRYIAPLLCILLSSWASAQSQSTQPETNDSDTGQQSEPGNSPSEDEKSEDEKRKLYEKYSKKPLSQLTSELKTLENQLQEKDDAHGKLLRSQTYLKHRIQAWTSNLEARSDEAVKAWKKFETMTDNLQEDSNKADLDAAKNALHELQDSYFELRNVFRSIFREEEARTMREYGVPVNYEFPRDWNSSSFNVFIQGPNKQSTGKDAHDKLKRILSNKEIPELLKSGLPHAEEQANALQESLNKEVSKRSSELTKLRSQIETLAQVVDDKSGADHKLTFAIYFMVAALIILYVATLFARESIQSTIFENRTLVEMIGMAFLLLTIIILGTGEKMDRSVLGALLGTVGGYIFGQQNRSSARPKRRKQANPDGPPRKKKKATELMTENVQRAAQEGTTTPPATKVPEMPSGMASSTPVTRAEITPPEALKLLPEQKPAAGS